MPMIVSLPTSPVLTKAYGTKYLELQYGAWDIAPGPHTRQTVWIWQLHWFYNDTGVAFYCLSSRSRAEGTFTPGPELL